MKPESLMMSAGYNPEWSEGSIKPPIFQTSTFVFKSAMQAKKAFANAYGLESNDSKDLIYTRINNPNLQIVEERLNLYEQGSQACAFFSSGMAAISTTLLSLVKPGDSVITSAPLYGGTTHFIKDYLLSIGVNSFSFKQSHSIEDIKRLIQIKELKNIKAIYIETPANPTNLLIDIKLLSDFAKSINAKLIVDNTYLGPIFQYPINFGADIVIYSATKFIGGHSDLVAGAVLGSLDDINKIKTLRTFFGNSTDSNTCWLLLRSLETLKIRMERQAMTAQKVAYYLKSHKNIDKVYYLEFNSNNQQEIFKKQCLSSGSMISFDVKGGEEEAFKVLDNLKLFKLAVSLGSNESLAQHPYNMTHAGVDKRSKNIYGINQNMIRISVGLEDSQDLIDDLDNALKTLN